MKIDELDFLRELEQDVQYLYARVHTGYSGKPEVTELKQKLHARIIQLLEEATNGNQS